MQLDPLPSECVVDQTLVIRVRDLAAGEALVARLYSAGGLGGAVIASEATFVADSEGVVDIARQAPVSGSYQGVDAMGLFWSRAPVTQTEALAFDDVNKDPFTATLSVSGEGGGSLSHSIRRTFTGAGVASRDVRENGLVGKMFQPPHPGPHPAVLVVGGSGGGLAWSQEMAGLLASHGYVALALAYFAAEGLSPTLDRIPLEYFGTALEWLAAQPCVAANRMAVAGASRGGELALLLGATFPSIRAVVAYVPSGIVWPAYPASGHGAWTMGGEEIPFAETLSHEEWDRALADGSAREDSFDWYLMPLRDDELVAKASIPVERINGPVLMITGIDDRLWPSTNLTEFAVQRFKKMNFPHRVVHLCYPGAGHSIAWPNGPTTMLKSKHPVSGEEMDMGGTPEDTARARQDSWPRMLEFLCNALADGQVASHGER
ncbi:acyl-CoA thioesterase/BAAT N-terminal domain-containing protein [Variovorax paradoxus]|nr:acyl-CoA thioesterase/BAAT N-terminal domain-containing protein [Variovorax paradoxus]